MKKLKILCSLTTAIILTGCATAKGPTYAAAPHPSPDNETAILYIYREYAEPLAVNANISIDDQAVASLAQKGFTIAKIAPGEHHVVLKWNSAAGTAGETAILQAEPNKTYVYEITSNNYWAFIKSHLKETPSDLGKAKMSGCCKYIFPKAERY